ncbi:hypothetical protein FE65_14895, partial [Staphylococcus aureus]
FAHRIAVGGENLRRGQQQANLELPALRHGGRCDGAETQQRGFGKAVDAEHSDHDGLSLFGVINTARPTVQSLWLLKS